MALMLGLDIGSSSVKAALLKDGAIAGAVRRAGFDSEFAGDRAETRPAAILKAIVQAVGQLGAKARRVDAVVPAVMAPSWLAMDRNGKPLTPIVTHQDRRSVAEAKRIEQTVGKRRHLQLAGNRPFPGGISSTTAGWFIRHRPGVFERAAAVGHLNTWLIQRWTGQTVTDPSNASFMGLYQTRTLGGWDDELCDAVGIDARLLPVVMESNRVAGRLHLRGSREIGLPQGTPVLAGCIDTSAVMLHAGCRQGQLVNNSGSTDVLAVCTNRPRVHAELLLRAVGIGRWWMVVSTLSAVGTTFEWIRQQLFGEWSASRFYACVDELARKPESTDVVFEPYLAGDRMSIDQRTGSFSGLTLATTRRQMLSAVIDAIARRSADRLPLLTRQAGAIDSNVVASGGVAQGLSAILQRDWPGRWHFRPTDEATLRGLATIEPVE